MERRDRSDRGRVARGVAPALLDRRRADDDLVAELGDRAVGLAGDEPPRAAPRLRRRERQRRLALVGDEDEQVGLAAPAAVTSSSACTASPPVIAAWNDVPQPVNSSRAPSGKRLSVGTCASQSGWEAIAVSSVRRARGVGLYDREGLTDLRAQHARQRPARPDGRSAARAVRRRARDAGRRLPLRDAGDERNRALLRAHVLQGNRAAADAPRRSQARSTRSAASSTPSPARRARRTTSSARPSTATSRSTSSSTCSATPASPPRRSSARRA